MTEAAPGAAKDHALERLIFFSDAVFAIAITLLVIEIQIPHLEPGAADSDFWQALARLAPSFVGYVISFAVIGAFWAGHHRAFGLAGQVGRGILLWNFLLLGTIAFMPFVTAFHNLHPGARVPALVYWGWLVLTALFNLRVNRIATGPGMRAAGVDAAAAAEVPRRSLAVLMAALTAFAVAWASPYVAPAAMATLPLWFWLLVRMRRAPA